MAITSGRSSPDPADAAGFRDKQDDVKIEPEGEEATKTSFGSSSDDSSAEESFRKMREELSACRKEKQEYMDGWQRSKADYVNLLRRIEEGSKASELMGKVRAVETLLPAFDALERAKEHGEVPEGFLAIAKQLEASFASLGLLAIGEIGEKFNPALHDALGQDVAKSAEEDNTITAVLEKGWKINDTVIRPAKVRVAHFG